MTHQRSRRRRIAVATLGALAVAALAVAVAGSLSSRHLITVRRTTTAPAATVWELWSAVPQRTRWDPSLEWATLDGPFQAGSRGTLKIHDQPAREFEIVEATPNRSYTDRYFLPLGARMDWEHTITDTGPDRREVVFTVTLKGPTSVVLAPILTGILNNELPTAVDQLIHLSEAR